MKKQILNFLIIIVGIFIFWSEILFGLHHAFNNSPFFAAFNFSASTIWIFIIIGTAYAIKNQFDKETEERIRNFLKNLPEENPLSLKSTGLKK